MKQCLRRCGFTLIEVVISCSIISIFFLTVSGVLGSAAKIYIQELNSSGGREAIATAADDIKNYVMSGKDIKLFFYMDGSRTEINGVEIGYTAGGLTKEPLPAGTFLYADGTYIKKGEAGGADLTGDLALTPDAKKKLEDCGEGIDLGYKKIYLSEDASYIHGLAYVPKYYKGMRLRLNIKQEDSIDAYQMWDSAVREKKQLVYTINLTGIGKNNIFTAKTNTAAASLNEITFP